MSDEGHRGVEPRWDHAFRWWAETYGVHGKTPTKKNLLIKKAVEAWDRAIEDYEPTEEELIAEDQLRMFCEKTHVALYKRVMEIRGSTNEKEMD
jgi:hypothetical protein